MKGLLKQIKGKGLEGKHGPMEQFIREIGLIIKLMVQGNLFMSMVMYMMVSGLMTKHKAMELTITAMEQSIKDNGKKINSMDLEYKHGQMVAVIKEITKWGRNQVKVNTFGKMVVHMKETGQIIVLLEKDDIYGQMDENIKGIG